MLGKDSEGRQPPLRDMCTPQPAVDRGGLDLCKRLDMRACLKWAVLGDETGEHFESFILFHAERIAKIIAVVN